MNRLYIGREESSIMPIDVKKLLENPALELFEELTAARLKHAGVTLGADLGLPTPKSDPNRGFSPELIRKLAGG